MKHFKSYIFIYLLIWIALINGSSFLLLKKYVEISDFKTARFHIFINIGDIMEELIEKKQIERMSDLNFFRVLNSNLLIINSIEKLSENMQKIDIRNNIKKRSINMYDITFNVANYDKNLIIKIIRDDVEQNTIKLLNELIKEYPKISREERRNFVIIITDDIATYKSKFSAIMFMMFVVSIITSFIILFFFKKIKTPIWLK
jgi:hypothetical protein